jgi:uncharacterized protein YfbU (UPF0304 family)
MILITERQIGCLFIFTQGVRSMKLDKLKRLELFNQFEILKHVDQDNLDHYENLQTIVSCGYEGEYYRLFEHISDEVSASITEEVKDTFDMFRQLNFSYSALSEEDKKAIDATKLKWSGFDGNHEPHYSVAYFYIEKLKLWQELGEYAINSHFTTRFLYPPMIEEWKKFKYGEELTKEQIQRILDAPQSAKKTRESIKADLLSN